MKTHRCEGSLKAKVSIRYSHRYPKWSNQGDKVTWRLFQLEIDSEYDTKYLSHVSEIKFCPFCGEELKIERGCI